MHGYQPCIDPVRCNTQNQKRTLSCQYPKGCRAVTCSITKMVTATPRLWDVTQKWIPVRDTEKAEDSRKWILVRDRGKAEDSSQKIITFLNLKALSSGTENPKS